MARVDHELHQSIWL